MIAWIKKKGVNAWNAYGIHLFLLLATFEFFDTQEVSLADLFRDCSLLNSLM